jgi:hypothetical protein
MRSLRRPAPLVLALCVLGFLVVVGSAFAIGSHSAATSPYQLKCKNGAVKAIVQIVADQNKGFQTDYTTDPTFFAAKWSCNAKAAFQARRVDRGIYDVRILGLTGVTPLVTPIGDTTRFGVAPQPDGGIRVTTYGFNGAGVDTRVDENFVLVLL